MRKLRQFCLLWLPDEGYLFGLKLVHEISKATERWLLVLLFYPRRSKAKAQIVPPCLEWDNLAFDRMPKVRAREG